MILRAWFRTIQLGIKSLLLHKLRSALTTLGLLFGVASVVAMLAVGEGASYEAQERIKALGSTNILIRSVKPPDTAQNSGQSVWDAKSYGLKYDDVYRILNSLPAVVEVVPVRETAKEMRAGEQYLSGVVLGTVPDYLSVTGMRVAEGRWLSDVDLARKTNTCVLGANASRRLFPLEDPIGQTIRVADQRFVVVGVLDELGRSSGSVGPSVDDVLFVPMTTSRAQFGDINIKRTGGSFEVENVELNEIKVKLRDSEAVLDSARVLRKLLANAHPDADYSLTVPLELLREAEAQARIWTFVLTLIASISLIVGGIGIMNVMLATVTERTREIGIRRALGARKRNIVMQFLVETVVLSAAGGLLGVGVGLGTPALITHFSGRLTVVDPIHPILAFSISAAVGIIAGLYPAWRAANMDPVEALRHE